VISAVFGEPYVDLEKEALALMKREWGTPSDGALR